MAQDQPGNEIFARVRPQRTKPSPPFYETNAFWGWFGAATGLVLTVIGMFSRADLGHWLLVIAWACASVAAWCAWANLKWKPRAFATVMCVLLIAAGLRLVDIAVIHSPAVMPSRGPLGTSPSTESAPTVSIPLKPKQPRQLSLTFKNSPLLTAQRREAITEEIEAFHRYLSAVGFDLTKEVPPMGTHPGNAITMALTTPLDSIFDAQISIPDAWLDNPDKVRNVYALWVFRGLFRAFDGTNPEWRYSATTASIFSCYFRASFIGRNVCDHDWVGRNWNNILWDVHRKKGKGFTDEVMLYTYKAWKTANVPDGTSFDDSFGPHFLKGAWIKDNRGNDMKDIDEVLRAQRGRR